MDCSIDMLKDPIRAEQKACMRNQARDRRCRGSETRLLRDVVQTGRRAVTRKSPLRHFENSLAVAQSIRSRLALGRLGMLLHFQLLATGDYLRGFGCIWAEAALQRADKVTATARRLEDITDLKGRFGEAVLPRALDVNNSEQVSQVVNAFLAWRNPSLRSSGDAPLLRERLFRWACRLTETYPLGRIVGCSST
jgi:hypothetical protein